MRVLELLLGLYEDLLKGVLAGGRAGDVVDEIDYAETTYYYYQIG